ncbi:MAG TPA: patatin-like phospholipase family protein [Pirellulales bacterium]|jgi:predicted acylesterase/phospholipase RssA|nr:patatin-like phospholipase family protein [Pirellulales bacterium]
MNVAGFLHDFFVPGFWNGFCRDILLFGEWLLLVSMLAGIVGKGNGVRLLFWHEVPIKQFLAGLATALVTSDLLFVAYLLHAQPLEDAWVGDLPPSLTATPILRAGCYVYGGWLCLAGLGAIAWLILKAARLAKHAAAPAQRDRTDVVCGTPFLLGALFAVLVATPAIGWALDSLADRIGPAAEHILPGGTNLPAGPHAMAAALALFWLCWYVATAWQKWSWANTPATGFCLVLALVASVYGFIRFRVAYAPASLHDWLFHPLVLFALLLVLTIMGGRPAFKFRFRDLAQFYPRAGVASPLVRDYPRQSTPEPKLVSWVDRIGNFPKAESDGTKRPLLVVCVSGGGLRAAVWTAAVLWELEKHATDLPYDIRLISGASGGMVGGAYYAASLCLPTADSPRHRSNLDHDARRWAGFSSSTDASGGPTNNPLLNRLADDMLSSVFKGLLFRDLPSLVWPKSLKHDRGTLLEDVFFLNMGSVWKDSFSNLSQGERAGWRPSLVFSPMLVEDGRRLLISNLDLEPLIQSRGNYVTHNQVYSQSAFELFRLFPEVWQTFSIATAARMSASFPYFSPAAVLPSEPRRRVVDAGYYDNYGVTIAADWLHGVLDDAACLAALQKTVSGVAVIEIRDGLSELNSPPVGLGVVPKTSPLTRGLEELTSPPAGLLSARDSVSLFRNDDKLAFLSERFNALFPPAAGGPAFFTNVLLQYDGDVPLSWYLTRSETANLAAKAAEQCTGPDGSAFLNWWRAQPHPIMKP